jgi:hypothetical protein
MNKKQQRAMKIAAQQALLNGAAGQELNDEQRAQFDTLQREINALTLEIEAEERQLEGQQPAAPAATPTAGQSGADGGQQQRDANQAAERAIQEERQRVADVTNICRSFGIDADEYIRDGHTIDQVRAAVLETLQTGGQPSHVQVTRDEGDTFRQRATDALLLRAGVHVESPAEGSDEFRAMSLRDLAIECLGREGRNTGNLLRMSSDDLYIEVCRQFYNPSAAFPAIMDQTIRKSIVQLYSEVPTTFESFTTSGTLKDFKETADHEYVIGGVGEFLKVPENGEIKPDKPRTELLPNRKLDTYGKQFSMTRQAFINDDIGFLTEVPGLYATAAKKTIDKQVYKILFNNDKIFDGVQLFSDKHNNLMKNGSAPSQKAIQSMVLKMQQQKDQFGEAIYITPKIILVPVGYEFDLAVIFHSAQVTGSNNNDYNPLYNYPLQTVQSPVLNALAGENACPWFMLGTGARGIQVDYLNGQKTPTVRRMEVPGTLGFVWDIYLDWGIAVRDWRSIVKNPGVKLESE